MTRPNDQMPNSTPSVDLDKLAAQSRGLFEKHLQVGFPRYTTELRRCLMCGRYQFSTIMACSNCDSLTVGRNPSSVLSGEDAKIQEARRDLVVVHKRRVRATLIIWGGAILVCLLLLSWSSWTFFLLPVPLAVAAAINLAYLKWTRDGFHQRHQAVLSSSSGATTREDENLSKQTDELMPAFLIRNQIRRFGRPAVGLEEQDTLILLLSKRGITVSGEQMHAFLLCCGLRKDYDDLSRILEGHERDELGPYHAYLNLVRDIDPEVDSIRFLQQYLHSRGKPHDVESIRVALDKAKTEAKVRNLEVDLKNLGSADGMRLTIHMVDIMDPFLFQDLIGLMYKSRGYAVHPTPKRGDQGADVIVEFGGERIVLQTKLWDSNVGNGAIQEVVAARAHWQCQRAVALTNRAFTDAAIELARSNRVDLIDRAKLCEMIEEFNKAPKDYRYLAQLVVPWRTRGGVGVPDAGRALPPNTDPNWGDAALNCCISDELFPFWSELDRMWVVPGTGAFDDLQTHKPWDSQNEDVKRVWEALTHPDHLSALETRMSQDMNPMAAEWTAQALKECKRRVGLQSRVSETP